MHATHRERSVVFLCVMALLALMPLATDAAELQFSPVSGEQAVGAEFTVKITIDPASESVNAADGTIAFDPDLLSVSSFSKEGSAFSLWTAEPQFSNSAGTLVFSGGSPTAFTAKATVLTVKFKAKKEGTATLSYSKGSILAADGKGTDVYTKGADASFTIAEGAAGAADEGSEDEAPDDAKPILPVISSLTHAKEDAWYATSTVEYAWKVSDDVTDIRTAISDAADATPEKTLKPEVTSETLTAVADGVWYVFVQFKNEFGWGDVAKRKIQIDTTPPTEFDVALVEDDAPKFTFTTEDALSGIDRYEIKFGETTAATVRAQDVTNGSIPVPPQAGGPQKVTIRAYDKAGNVREVIKDFTLPEVVKATPKKAGEEVESAPIITVERVLLLLFAMAIGAIVMWTMQIRKAKDEEKARILRELSIVRDKNDKIFSAMREEFEQMVNDLDEKPQLTPQERDFLENIKETLDISEELVDSSMEELKKSIRV